MFKRALITVSIVLVLLAASLVILPHLSDNSVKAASVQQWSYGMYVIGKANTGLHSWFELDEEGQKAVQDIVDLEENPNIVSVFNLLGAMGWEFISIDKQDPLTLYIFKRPSE